MAAVFEHSTATGAARLVLLAIADSAHDSGLLTAYPRSQKLLAHKARMDDRTVRRAINTLTGIGELEVLKRGDGRDQADYQVHLAGLSEGGREAHPGRARRRPRAGEVPAPSSRPTRPNPVTPNPSAGPDGHGGAQAPLPDMPTAAPKGNLAARSLIQRVWDSRDPRPATPFIALVKIAGRLLDAGHSPEAVEAAFMAAPAYTVAALEFQLNGGRTNGNGRNHVTDSGPPRDAWAVDGAFFNNPEVS
jgi:hypothetical protein